MLLVKTTTGPSKIHGTGLFATELVPKGTIVWRFTPDIDESYSEEEVERLAEPHRGEVLSFIHSYISKATGKYIWCGDDARYMNHSEEPNVGMLSQIDGHEEVNPTLRDVQPGEELTIDYRTFAADVPADLAYA